MPWQVLVLDPATRTYEPRPTETLPAPPTDGRVVWIDLQEPSTEELEEVGRLYGLHHLELEDCLHEGQRPKLESYEDHVFIVMHHPTYDPHRHKVRLQELHMFVGMNFVITSHKQPMAALGVVRERWREAEETRTEGAAFLAYLISDTLVDDYFPVLDKLGDRLSGLDELVFRESQGKDPLHVAFHFKRQLLYLRRVVGPTRDAFVWLVRREQPLITRAASLHFQDVYDHLIRVADTLDLYRDLAGSVQEVYLTMVANKTNLSMKRLTAFTITLMSVTLVSSIYGMNFRYMPELGWPMGYAWALGIMAVLGLGSLGIFKLRGYF